MSTLFQGTRIGTLTVTNRFVRSATVELLGDDDGRPLPELSAMYRALAEGGVGLIISGSAYIDPSGKAFTKMSGIHDDALIPDWQKVTDAVHEAGGKIAMQIMHGGRHCAPNAVSGPLLAPSPVPVKEDGPRPVELSECDIRRLIRAYALAAGRAKEASFDAVQLHGAHGYLIHSFNSPASNWRRDAWGGTLARRLHFLKEVATAARDVVGDDYPLFIKLGTVDFVPDGMEERDGVEIIRHLRDMGFDAVEISGGIGFGGSIRKGIRRQEDEAYFLPVARQARHVTDLPIILVGGMRSKEVMESILKEGSADLISLCRPLIREPDLPNRIRNGQDKATCISCFQCWPKEGELGISCHYRRETS